jgi:hypothetical protein
VASCAVFVPAAAVERGSPVSVGELDSTTVAVPVVLISLLDLRRRWFSQNGICSHVLYLGITDVCDFVSGNGIRDYGQIAGIV